MKKLFLAALIAAPVILTSCNSTRPKATLKTTGDTLSYELGMANAPSEEQLKSYLADPRTGSDSIYIEEFLKGFSEGLKATGDKKKAAYLAGLQFGAQMGQSLDQTALALYEDSTATLSHKNFQTGFVDALYGKKSALKIDGQVIDQEAARADVNDRMKAIREEAVAKKYADKKKASEAFISKKAKEAGIVKLPGGTLCHVITQGTGTPAKDGERVNVVYEGSLTDGKVFDASAAHPGADGKSTPMVVGTLVPGFNEILKTFPAGTELEAYIPYDQAYGAEAAGPDIEPFSALVFKITILGPEGTPAATPAPAPAQQPVKTIK